VQTLKSTWWSDLVLQMSLDWVRLDAYDLRVARARLRSPKERARRCHAN
jgi:hypothetical protein